MARKKPAPPAPRPSAWDTASEGAWRKRAALAESRALKALRTGGNTADPIAADIVRRARRRAAAADRKGMPARDKFAATAINASMRGVTPAPGRRAPAPRRADVLGGRGPAEYVARVDYASKRSGHGRTVELRLYPTDGRARTREEVAEAVQELARGIEPDGWEVRSLAYGKADTPSDELTDRGRTISPDELGGLLGRIEPGGIRRVTVGREDRDDDE